MKLLVQNKWEDVRCLLLGARTAWVSVLSTALGFLLFFMSSEARDLFHEVGAPLYDVVFWSTFYLLVVLVWTLPVFFSARWILTQFQEGTAHAASIERVPIWVKESLPTTLVIFCFAALFVGQFGALQNAPNIRDATIDGVIASARSELEIAAKEERRSQQQSKAETKEKRTNACASEVLSDDCRKFLRSTAIVMASIIKEATLGEAGIVYSVIGGLVLWFFFGAVRRSQRGSVGSAIGLLAACGALSIVILEAGFSIGKVFERWDSGVPVIWLQPYISYASISLMFGIVAILLLRRGDANLFRILWWVGTLLLVPAIAPVAFGIYAIVLLENEAEFGLVHLVFLPFATIGSSILLWALVRRDGLVARIIKFTARLTGTVGRFRLLNPIFFVMLGSTLAAMFLFLAVDVFSVTDVVHRALLVPFLLGLPVAVLTYVTYWSMRSRFPFVFAAILLAGIFGVLSSYFRGDFYVVRTLSEESTVRQGIDDAIRQWARANECVLTGDKREPATQIAFKDCTEIAPIIVASAGGASRAAFHTAGVIGALLDKQQLAPITAADGRGARGREFNSAVFSPDGKLILTASFDRTARLWDASSGKEVAKLVGHGGGVYGASFSPDGMKVVTAAWEKVAPVRLWDVSDLRNVREISRLIGHTEDVNSAEFSPNAKLIVTASDDKTVRVWDAETSTELVKFVGHLGLVHGAAFSPDGKLVVSAAWERTAPVRVWSVSEQKEVGKLLGHKADVNSAFFSSDGKRIVTASDDATVRIWEVDTGKEIAELKGHSGAVFSARFSPDNRILVSGSYDNTARIWDVSNIKSPKELHRLKKHINDVRYVSFKGDGSLIITASKDRTVRVWNARTGQLEPWNVQDNRFRNQLFAISAVSGGAMGAVVTYAALADSQRKERAINGLNRPPCLGREARIDRDYFRGKYSDAARLWRDCLQLLVAGDFLSPVILGMTSSDLLPFHWRGDRAEILERAWERRYARLTDQKESTLSQPLAQVRRSLTKNGWVPLLLMNGTLVDSGRRIITSDVDLVKRDPRGLVISGAIRDAEDLHSILGTLEKRGGNTDIRGVAIAKNGMVATASRDQMARTWDASTGDEIATFKGHTAPLTSVGFSFDGQKLLTSSLDTTARIWDVKSKKQIGPALKHPKAVNSAAFSEDGRFIVTASSDLVARVWDIEQGVEVKKLIGHEGAIFDAAFSPDGSRIVTAAWERKAPVRLWNANSGDEIQKLIGHSGDVNSASFSSDGKWIVTASDDRTARIWDAQSGVELRNGRLKGHSHFVYGAQFSPDKKRVVTVSRDRRVLVWDISRIEAEAPRIIARGFDHDRAITSVSVSGGGTVFVTGSEDRTARLWDLERGDVIRYFGHYDVLLPCKGAGCDIRLSTAITMSSRFPIISPPGSIVHSRDVTRTIGRVVDGGYHDNFGATTARELKRALAKRGLNAVVILINTEHTFNGLECVEHNGDREKGLHISQLRAGTWSWFPTFLSPVDAIQSSRVGRASHAAVDLCMELREEQPSQGAGLKGDDRFAFITVGKDLTPVSWWMSKRVQRNLDDQLQDASINAGPLAKIGKMLAPE